MRRLSPLAALAAALCLPAIAVSQAPPPAPVKSDVPAAKPKYDEDTPYGVLMRDPAAKNVLIEDWPLLVTALEMGGVPETSTMRGALTSESARSQGGLTDALYAKVIADLKKL